MKQAKRITKRMLALLLALTLLGGCKAPEAEQGSSVPKEVPPVSSEPVSEREESQKKEPAEGGKLCMAIPQPETLLPWQVTDAATADFLMLIYSPLVNMKEDGSLLPCLAESWSWSEDLEALTLQLRAGVTFHNGQALTAADVVYSIEKLKSAQNAFSAQVAGITTAEIAGEGSVRIHFAAAGRQNEEQLVFPIMPAGVEEALRPVGTGPYAYKAVQTRREMQLIRYDGYFGAQPFVPEVTALFVKDTEAVLRCFDTTRTNLMRMDETSWGTYVNARELTVHRYESYEALYLEFQTGAGFSATLSNRQKVAYAIDAVRVMRDAYWGKGEVTETLLRPDSWYAPEPEQKYGYHAEKAADMRVVGDNKVRLLYNAQDAVQVAAVETIRNQLEAAGLSVQLTTSGGYDIALRREKATLQQVVAKLGAQAQMAGARSEDEVRKVTAALGLQMQEELPVYNLFFLTKGAVTGFGLEGELMPSDWNAYAAVEGIYAEGGENR